MTRWKTLHVLAALLCAGMWPAAAQNSADFEVAFAAAAEIGNTAIPVQFQFTCSSNEGDDLTGVLSVVLRVADYEKTHALFDFDPFEGPDATAGARSLLRAEGGRAAGDRFTAAGSIVPTDAADAFAFEVTASRREAGPLRKLGAALRPLTTGAGRFVWRQDSAKPGGKAIIASLDLDQARSEQLKLGLGSCLGRQ